MANIQRGARLLRALTVAYVLPLHTCEFSLQVIDLTHGWSNAMTEQIAHADLLAMVAAVYIYVKLRVTPEQRYTHALLQPLEAFAAQFLRKSSHAVSSTSR